MDSDIFGNIDQYSRGQYQPTTFLERGVSLPFTTPILIGARLRLAERAGMELVIANPGGGRGSYVMPWSALPEICVPTLHDRKLWALLATEPMVSPGTVRRAARRVVQEGLAGRAAAAAADMAERERDGDRVRANFLLLMRVIRRQETAAEATIAPERDLPERLELRAKRALGRVAPQLGLAAEDVAGCLEEVATTIQDIGGPGDPKPARARRSLQELEIMAREVAEWGAVTPATQDSPVVEVIAEAARLTLACCDKILRELDAMIADPLTLLKRYRQDQAGLRQLAVRPEWLLDGWALLCAMWRDAPDHARLAISRDIALLAPILPREAERWSGIEADWERPVLLRRRVKAREDWRTGRMITMIEARERALALAP
jgi:hypothetical protein